MKRLLLSVATLAAFAPGIPASYAQTPPDFAAELATEATIVVSPDQGRMVYAFRFKNTGALAWQKEGQVKEAISLATFAPDHANSPFFDPASWHSANRITMVESIVTPGDTGTFRFSISTPTDTGTTHRTSFRLVREHIGYFGPTVVITTGAVGSAPSVDAPATDTPSVGNGAKKAEINLKNNTLTMWEGDVAIATHSISPGKWKTPTPIGTFKIQSKAPVAYSKTYKLWMPYWNSIGRGYGIHGLPYWKRGNKVIIEGANHIGRNVSHGCVRLPAGADKQFFEWATPGTTVWIHR